VLPGELKSAGATWSHGLIGQKTADGGLVEPEVLTAVVHADHTAFVIALDESIEEGIKDVSVEDGNGEDVAYEVERVNGDPEGEDTDPVCVVRLSEGPELLLVGVVDGSPLPSCSGLPRNSSLLLAHHVAAPQVKVRAVLGR
jgi:hypothetical protein